MKNLNKVLAMVLVVVMAMTSVVFADFTDVTAETAYAEAINVGAALGLFNGYEDGTFKPEGDITRAEFAAIVVRALNQEAQAASAANAASDFADVAEDHWAKGYINIVSKLGIVNGYGDGNFGPEDLVLYEQAVKMLVVALGYEPAIGAAGYPVGYLTKASEIGLTTGVKGSNGVAANRGIVAQLTVNALNVPVMKQVGYGTWVDYEVQDGTAGTAHRTLLSDNLGMVKLTVEVLDTSLTATTASHIDENITVKVINNFKTRYADDDAALLKGAKKTKIYVGDTAASTLVGNKAVIYAAYDELDQELVALYAGKDTTKTYELTVTTTNLENVEAGKDVVVFEYWENETDKKPESVELDPDASVYVNGVASKDDVVKSMWKNGNPAFYGQVTLQLLDSDSDYDYDTVFVEDIETLVVDENNTTRYTITAKNDADKISYDPKAKDVSAVLYDENGEEMDWADLVEYDVVSIKRASNATDTKEIIEGRKISAKVTGAVTAIDNEGEADVKYYIGGEAYGAYYLDKDNLSILVGDEGDFYLDVVGNVAYFEATAAVNTNYAYIVNIGKTASGLEDKVAVKIFTFDGQYGTVDLATKIKLDGVSGVKTADIDEKDYEVKNFNDKEYKALVSKQGATGYTYDADKDVLTLDKLVAGDIITYTTNSAGVITSIDRATAETDFAKDDRRGKFTYVNATGADYIYDEKSGSVSANGKKFYVSENTVIMVAETNGPAAIEDNFMLFSAANIVDEQVFENARVFNADSDKNAGLIVVESEVDVATSGTILALVTGIGSGNNEEGDSILNVKALQHGLVKDGKVEAYLTTVDDLVEIEQFATIIPKYNAAGEVTNKTVTLATIGNGEVDFNDSAIAKEVKTTGTTVDYIYGEVAAIDRKTIELANGKEIDVDAKTIVYVYDAGLKAANRASIDGIDYVEYDEDEDAFFIGRDECSKVEVLAREYDGDITEVVLYIFR